MDGWIANIEKNKHVHEDNSTGCTVNNSPGPGVKKVADKASKHHVVSNGRQTQEKRLKELEAG